LGGRVLHCIEKQRQQGECWVFVVTHRAGFCHLHQKENEVRPSGRTGTRRAPTQVSTRRHKVLKACGRADGVSAQPYASRLTRRIRLMSSMIARFLWGKKKPIEEGVRRNRSSQCVLCSCAPAGVVAWRRVEPEDELVEGGVESVWGRVSCNGNHPLLPQKLPAQPLWNAVL
jgi:hypothetical protein